MSAGPILIMAGGTGGHVYPALAVANALRDESREVVWLGTRAGLEARVIPAATIPIEWISVSGLRGKGRLAWLLAPFRITYAVLQALRILRRRKPAAVLGMGGFVTGPGGLAAWLMRKPLIIHEQNAVAGLTNRILSRFAARVLEAFPGSFPPAVPAETVGNPVRKEIAEVGTAQPTRDETGDAVRILILGGSQGALKLNRTVPGALAKLGESTRLDVWHQAGPRTLDTAIDAYRAAAVEAKVVPFIEEMHEAYRWADLVICRAGALTVSELASVGRGAIFVPFPGAVDDHQTKNAEFLVREDAAVIIPDAELTPERLAAVLETVVGDRRRLREMGQNARRVAVPDSVRVLTEACMNAGVAA